MLNVTLDHIEKLAYKLLYKVQTYSATEASRAHRSWDEKNKNLSSYLQAISIYVFQPALAS